MCNTLKERPIVNWSTKLDYDYNTSDLVWTWGHRETYTHF